MDKLIRTIQSQKNIKNYRIYKTISKDIVLGVKGEIIGGPYNPIQTSFSINGELQIEWKDKEISLVNLTSSSFENPEETIAKAYETKISDKHQRIFLLPYKEKIVKSNQYSKRISDFINNKQETLIQDIKNLYNYERSIGINKHESTIEASETHIELSNSKGLNLEDNFSSYGFASSWDDKLSFGYDEREPFSVKTYLTKLKFLAELYKSINKQIKVKRFKINNIKVILSPEITLDILNQFIFENLNGSFVANGMSRFTKQDFNKKKKLFADWFTLKINPLKLFTPGAYNFTQEGVLCKQTTFIDKGKMITPILNLKHASILKFNPTPTITEPYILSFCNTKKLLDLEKYIKSCKEAIFVPYFLGLHTQNQMTGDYSLVSPYTIYIKDGKLMGRFKTIVRGNIFEDLNNDIELVKSETFPLPGICYNPKVIIE